MARKQVVFIMALPHSGSSLLALILGSHSRVFGLGEVSRLYGFVNRRFDDYPRLCRICEGPCAVWNGRAQFGVLRRYFRLRPRIVGGVIRRLSQLHRSIYSYFFHWTGADVLVDSSKGDGWVGRQLAPSYHWKMTDPFVIYLTRDGRALLNSALHRQPELGAERLTEMWKSDLQRLDAVYRSLPAERKMHVTYEALSTRPDEVIAAVCQRLGIAYEPDMLRYWEHDHHIIDSNVGTRSLIWRYRAEQAQPAAGEAAVLQAMRKENGQYYDRLGLGISLDLRWKTQLTAEQLADFERVAGEANRPFAFDG